MLKNIRRLGTWKSEKSRSMAGSSSPAATTEKEEAAPSSSSSSSSCTPPQPRREPRRVWREARDPKTGRTYYYDVETRETQWNKPVELLDDSERREVRRREEEKRAFFEEMETNMKRRFADGLTSVDDVGAPSSTHGIGWRLPRASSGGSLGGDRLVRTLSTMDDSVLLDNTCSIGGGGSVSRVSTRLSLSPRGRDSSLLNAESTNNFAVPRRREQPPSSANDRALPADNNQRATAQKACQGSGGRGVVTSRNSTGTLYLETTLDAPDKDATIRCVCHVIRAHISAGASSKSSAPPTPRAFDVFYDDQAAAEPPSTRRLVSFYRDVFSRGQMEVECIVTSLIYVERLLKAARGKFRLRPCNWRPVLLSCMIMASKVCDDLSMWNADFSHICRAFNLARINALEAALLQAYGFNATVSASEYAKYYFHLRSMAVRLGLLNSGQSQPLDVRQARAVAARSSKRFSFAAAQNAAAAPDVDIEERTPEKQTPPSSGAKNLSMPHVRRAQSIGVESHIEDAIKRNAKPKTRPAILEQIVDMAPQPSNTGTP